jgi:glycerol kinase
MEHTQIYPEPGWVEHDPLEIWKNVEICMEKALEMAKITRKQVVSVGITNQRETTVVWNKKTGKPYYNAIVWNDGRTANICDDLSRHGGKDRLRGL